MVNKGTNNLEIKRNLPKLKFDWNSVSCWSGAKESCDIHERAREPEDRYLTEPENTRTKIMGWDFHIGWVHDSFAPDQ